MYISHNLDCIKAKFEEAATGHIPEAANILHAASQLLALLKDQKFSVEQKNDEIDIIIMGTLAIAATFYGSTDSILASRFQSRPKSWDDFMSGFDDLPEYSAGYFSYKGTEQCLMILRIGTELMNHIRHHGDHLNALEVLFYSFKEDLICTQNRKAGQNPNYVYKSMNLEKQQDYKAIETIFADALKTCEVYTDAEIERKKKTPLNMLNRQKAAFQSDPSKCSATEKLLNSGIDAASKLKSCKGEEYKLRKNFHSALSELKTKTLKDFRNHKKMFNAENCKILANSAGNLATAFAANNVTQQDIANFKNDIKNFRGCEWLEAIAYTLLTILITSLTTACGALIGGIIAGPAGMVPGAISGFTIGGVAGCSFTMWYRRATDPCSRMTDAAAELPKTIASPI